MEMGMLNTIGVKANLNLGAYVSGRLWSLIILNPGGRGLLCILYMVAFR